jgi:hypothetical protein
MIAWRIGSSAAASMKRSATPRSRASCSTSHARAMLGGSWAGGHHEQQLVDLVDGRPGLSGGRAVEDRLRLLTARSARLELLAEEPGDRSQAPAEDGIQERPRRFAAIGWRHRRVTRRPQQSAHRGDQSRGAILVARAQDQSRSVPHTGGRRIFHRMGGDDAGGPPNAAETSPTCSSGRGGPGASAPRRESRPGSRPASPSRFEASRPSS